MSEKSSSSSGSMLEEADEGKQEKKLEEVEQEEEEEKPKEEAPLTKKEQKAKDAERKQKEKEEKKQAAEEADRAERLKVRKVSPIKRFFSSIRVLVIIVLVLFVLVACAVVGATALIEIRKVYEQMDTLTMKERIQNAISGTLETTASIVSRAALGVMYLGFYPETMFGDPSDPSYERALTSTLYYQLPRITEGPGFDNYQYMPFHLMMAWDGDWNERMIYYRPCADVNDRSKCDLLPPKAVFRDIDHGDFELVYKNAVPSLFRSIKDKKPTVCDTLNFTCNGIADINISEGGPMFFTMFSVGQIGSDMMPYPMDNWTFLIASNALIFNQIAANRTGLCVSIYSSTEDDLPSEVKEEIKRVDKNKHKPYVVLNPNDAELNSTSNAVMIHIDTGNATTRQKFVSKKKSEYHPLKRGICDDYYDHGDDNYVSKTTTFLSYSAFDFDKFDQSDKNTILFRYEYHDPLTKSHVEEARILVAVICVVWALTILGVFLYFNFVFLVPLDGMRKLRGELIKTTLSYLEDDGVAAKDMFGDMTDDTALIQANGDEIAVMHTLQVRVEEIYNNITETRIAELNRLRRATRNGFYALKIMNAFLRRDDEALRAVLPGLMDPNEIARKYRRTTLVVRSQEDDMINELANAKRTFRTLKAVLSNNIATQFFKAFCTQRGRSSLNSFFFLMDVSWLHQVEAGARNEQDDFLSAMFSDSVAPSPSFSPSQSGFLSYNKSNETSDLLLSPENSVADIPGAERPHHSHFAKKDSRNSSPSSSSRPSPSPSPLPPEEADDGKKLKMKLPVFKSGSGNNNQPSGAASPGNSSSVQFASKLGAGIAHFIFESYFGRKSLAQRDMRHAALLGCSQVPDYLQLRDNTKPVFSPTMFDNLVTAVTKKFTAEVLPQFRNSVSFQVMIYTLKLIGFFEAQQRDHQEGEDKEAEDNAPLFKDNDMLKGMWPALVNPEAGKKKAKKKTEDDDSSSTSDDDDSDDDDDEDEDDKDHKDDEKVEEKKEEKKPASEEKVDASEKVDVSESEKPSEKEAKKEAEKKEEAKKEKDDDSDDDESSSSSSSDDD